MSKTRSASTRSWATIAACAAMAAFVVVLAPSCGGSGGSATQCSMANTPTGCPSGQACTQGKDGMYGCFCSVSANTGCTGGEVCLAGASGDPGCFCDTDTEAGCTGGKVCEEVMGSTPACFTPVTVGGKIFDLSTGKPIAGAHVVGRDANFAALTGVAISDAMGHYDLEVPMTRTASGGLTELQIFLRADAQDYITFPTPPRIALPVEVSMAAGMPPHLENSATSIGMVPLESTTGLGSVSGKVEAKVPVGTLVVAGGAAMTGGGVTGIADTDGSYTVFNVPAGSVTVKGYKVGIQLAPAMATVTAGKTTPNVNLADKGKATATVSGMINIVNPGMGSTTSVILAVDETFDPNAARGQAPPGLRVAGISGAFSIPNVPDGNYVVLAAFENDYLTRDPDTSIGGTSIVHITVAGQSMALSQSFKVTGSLDNPSPDGEETVSGTPTFTWDDIAGEDHYEVHVFDAYGTEVWSDTSVPSVMGAKTVSVMYAGPALKSGGLYQFRAIAIKKGGSAIAMTEDLKGVFLYK